MRTNILSCTHTQPPTELFVVTEGTENTPVFVCFSREQANEYADMYPHNGRARTVFMAMLVNDVYDVKG